MKIILSIIAFLCVASNIMGGENNIEIFNVKLPANDEVLDLTSVTTDGSYTVDRNHLIAISIAEYSILYDVSKSLSDQYKFSWVLSDKGSEALSAFIKKNKSRYLLIKYDGVDLGVTQIRGSSAIHEVEIEISMSSYEKIKKAKNP